MLKCTVFFIILVMYGYFATPNFTILLYKDLKTTALKCPLYICNANRFYVKCLSQINTFITSITLLLLGSYIYFYNEILKFVT